MGAITSFLVWVVGGYVTECHRGQIVTVAVVGLGVSEDDVWADWTVDRKRD